MLAENIEFLLSQYADGTLPVAQRPAVEKLLAEDPAAAAQLEAYCKLDALLRQASPVPAIRWDVLAERISSAVAEQRAPAQMDRLPRAWFGAATALAASLLIAFGLLIRWQRAAQTHSVAINLLPAGTAQVTGPGAEGASGQAVAEVRLDAGPPAATASDAVVVQPSHITIASALPIRGEQ